MAKRKPRGWREAEWMYESLLAERMFPMPHGGRSSEDLETTLRAIVERCERFYPAILELGVRLLLSPATAEEGEQLMERGFPLLLELVEPEHEEELVGALLDNLERVKRFDLEVGVARTMVARDPGNASWHDSLAIALTWVGEVEAAATEQSTAVSLATTNAYLRNNQGWTNLLLGRLGEARSALEEAGRLDPEVEAVALNLQVLEYLEEHGGDFLHYLSRPLDRAQLERLGAEEEWEEVEALCHEYDSSRLQLLIFDAMRGDVDRRRRLPDLLSTLTQFFTFVRYCRVDYHLNEDVEATTRQLKPLMHKFIFKHRDADGQLVGEVFAALLAFYGFLAEKGVITARQDRAFASTAGKLRPGLLRKADRYASARQNPRLSKAKKERLQDELFEGDHLWPNL